MQSHDDPCLDPTTSTSELPTSSSRANGSMGHGSAEGSSSLAAQEALPVNSESDGTSTNTSTSTSTSTSIRTSPRNDTTNSDEPSKPPPASSSSDNPQSSHRGHQAPQAAAQGASGSASKGLLFNQRGILIGTRPDGKNQVVAQMPPPQAAAINGAPASPSFVAVPAGQMQPQFQFYSLGNMHNQVNVPTFYGSMPPFGLPQPQPQPQPESMNHPMWSMKPAYDQRPHGSMDSLNSKRGQEGSLQEEHNNSEKIQKAGEIKNDPLVVDSCHRERPQGYAKKRIERDVLWMNQYNALKAFHEENGHSNVPMHYATNKRLGHWINNQRQLYRKYKNGLPSSMTEKRIELLEALNFAWVLGKDWKQRQRAKQKLQEGTSSGSGGIPKSGSSNTLSNHSATKSLDTSEHSIQISDQDSKLSPKTLPAESSMPKRKFEEVQDSLTSKLSTLNPAEDTPKSDEPSIPAKKRHTEMDKSPSNQTEQNLGEKIKQQSPPSVVLTPSATSQDNVTNKFENQSSEQATHDVNVDVAFPQSPTDCASPIPTKVESDDMKSPYDELIKGPSKLSDIQWQKHLTHLTEFKATYGHCNVPFQYVENKSLGYWVHNQRQVYKKWLKGEPCSLTQSRIESLIDLGFSLKSQRTLKKEKICFDAKNSSISDKEDDGPIQVLLEEKIENGTDISLSEAQRDDSMDRTSTAIPSNQTSPTNQTNATMDLPMPMVIRKHPDRPDSKVKIDAFDVLWNRRLTELRDFHLDNGHSDVPSNYLPNKPLGIWAMNQRQQYRKYKNGEKSSLTPQRIAALETLHFRWYLGKGTRGKDKAGRKQGKYPPSTSRPSKNNPTNQKTTKSSKQIQATNSGISLLTDDLINFIISYLPCIRSVVSFCSTSKRFVRILWSIHMERICKSMYISNYGLEGLNLQNENKPFFWKKAWQNIYCFRRALKTQAILDEVIIDNQGDQSTQRKTLGILSPAAEDEAIFYDNPSLAPENSHEYNLGYFGLTKFYVKVLTPLLGGNEYHKEFSAVWGDFNGLRILDSPMNQGFNYEMQYRSVGDQGGFGQVLTVLSPPMKHASLLFPCIYLGCASGTVLSVCARCDPNLCISFAITSLCYAHSNEITALAWLPGKMSSCNSEYLVSGGCDGNVYLYPDALSVPKNFNMNNRVLCCVNGNQTPILSLATSKMEFRDHWLQVLFTGDSDGNIILWNSQALPNSLDERLRPLPAFTSIKVVNSSDHCRITSLKVVNDENLIAGDTSGNVRVWDIIEAETDIVRNGRKVLSQNTSDLSILFKIPAAHGGTIEKIEVVGNVLLTTGGSDGFVRGWELKRGDLIGSVLCHPGVLPHQLNKGFGPTLKSSVVGFLFTDCNTCMTLCRDGNLHLWNYGSVSTQEINFQIRRLSWDNTTREIECGVIPAAAVLSNLAGTTTSALLIPHSNPPAKALGLQSLKKIMTCDGNPSPTVEQSNLRDRMRLAIIKAAYEHASNSDWQKFPETPFIGADGKVYRYIKKAFSTFSGMRPCKECKRNNRGAYRCRLQLKHDSSDVDEPGHNSLNTLRSAINHDSKTYFEPSKVQNQTLKTDEETDSLHKTDSIDSEESKITFPYPEMTKEDVQLLNSATSWKCHKCDKINLNKNKRCPSCSAWRGGKRNAFGNSLKKNKKQAKKCSFCQHSNSIDANVCEMCHEPFQAEQIVLPPKEKSNGSKNIDSSTQNETVEKDEDTGIQEVIITATEKKNDLCIEWKCHKCDRINPSSAKRCKSCLSWKGGTRQLNFTRRKTENKEKGDTGKKPAAKKVTSKNDV